MRWNQAHVVTCFALLACLLSVPANAQTTSREWAPNVIMPHCRQPSVVRNQIQVTGVKATVVINEEYAETTLQIDVKNHGSTAQTAELLLPAHRPPNLGIGRETQGLVGGSSRFSMYRKSPKLKAWFRF